MGRGARLLAVGLLCLIVTLVAAGVGSVPVHPADTFKILLDKLFGVVLEPMPDDITVSILWWIRTPRVLLAFLVGAALSLSGAVMQSVLRNPLASSYTLGVSSGAALGASLCILFGVSVLGHITLPVFGLVGGVATVLAAVAVAGQIDRSLSNVTVILTGMAFSLFANALLTLALALAREKAERMVFWQMGSFALKEFYHPAVLLPVVLIGFGAFFLMSPELDMMALGDEQAAASGVDIKRLKWMLLITAAVLTGFSVALAGVIGFVDLFTPHVARRIFGARHRWVLPASMLMGGGFMVLCDLAARTVAAPYELPVGAVASIVGVPFFAILFFRHRKGAA